MGYWTIAVLSAAVQVALQLSWPKPPEAERKPVSKRTRVLAFLVMLLSLGALIHFADHDEPIPQPVDVRVPPASPS